MPKVSATDAIKVRRYVSEFPEFEVCGENELYCPLCICTVNYRKRDFVTAHRNTKKHATAIRNKESKYKIGLKIFNPPKNWNYSAYFIYYQFIS